MRLGDEQEQDRGRGGSEKIPMVSISRVSSGVLQKNKEDVQTPATGQSWKLNSIALQSFNLSLWWSSGAWLGKQDLPADNMKQGRLGKQQCCLGPTRLPPPREGEQSTSLNPNSI